MKKQELTSAPVLNRSTICIIMAVIIVVGAAGIILNLPRLAGDAFFAALFFVLTALVCLAFHVCDMKDMTHFLNSKRGFIITGINAIVITLCYIIFLFPHYSVDTYSAVVYGSAGTQDGMLAGGRVVAYAISIIENILQYQVGTWQIEQTLYLVLTSALSASILLNCVLRYFKDCTPWGKAAVHISILIIFSNVFFLEYYLYIETMLAYGTATLTACAAAVVLHNKASIRSILFGFLLMLIALNCYQAMLATFLITGYTCLLLRHECHCNKSAVVTAVAITAVAAVASEVAFSENCWLLPILGSESDKIGTISLKVIQNNLLGILGWQKRIWHNGNGFMLPGLPIMWLIALLCGLGHALYQKKAKLPSRFLFTAILLFGGYASIFVEQFIARHVWLPPRSIVPYFAFLGMFMVLDLNCRFSPALLKSITVVCGVLLVIEISQCWSVMRAQIKVNQEDVAEIAKIQSAIDRYEQQYSQAITKIAVTADASMSCNYPNTPYVGYEICQRAMSVKWATKPLIKYASGRTYEFVEMDTNIYNTHFANKNWTSFDASEQMVFVGDTLYLAVY